MVAWRFCLQRNRFNPYFAGIGNNIFIDWPNRRKKNIITNTIIFIKHLKTGFKTGFLF
jgi:hypothetical protein